MQPQPGIFGLGTPEHCFVELDLCPGADPAALISALAAASGPETTVAGVNVVVGFRPELWDRALPDVAVGARSFEPVAGPEVTFPATQHDGWVWVAGGRRDVVFDSVLRILAGTEGLATVGSELTGWIYQHRRDLTGFIDGTENPPVLAAPAVAVVTEGPAAGSSVLLYQQWRHLDSWRRLSVEEQERVIGRTRDESAELEDLPVDSHVSRNVIEEHGEELAIYRRNVAYGGPTDHGTVFVGFCAGQRPLQLMLERMAGADGAARDALTRHTTALTGAYYVVPSVDSLRRFVDLAGRG